jgi:hypothetical protein
LPRLTGMSTKGIKREMWSLRWNIATNPDKALRPTTQRFAQGTPPQEESRFLAFMAFIKRT